MAQINTMTPEQEAYLPQFRWEQFEVGICTEPADKPRAEAAFAECYKLCNFQPVPVIWVQSPRAACYLIDALLAGGKREARFKALLSDQAALDAALLALRGTPVEVAYTNWWGQMDVYWLAFYNFGAYLGVEYEPEAAAKLAALTAIAESCCWWYPYDTCIIACDRPELVQFAPMEPGEVLPTRLHNTTGPAVRFRDGFSCYAWNGVVVPGDWIDHPESLTPAIALKTTNIEQRRAACEILGWAKILDSLNAITINKDDDPQVGELLEVNLPDSGKERFLRVLCGTGRTFCIPVPPTMKTALEANAWTYNIEPDIYKQLEIRT